MSLTNANGDDNGEEDAISLMEEPSCSAKDTQTNQKQANEFLYAISDTPPWYACIVLGFQHYLTMFGGTVSVPLLLAHALCMDSDNVGKSELIGTIFFVSGLSTILQTTVGNRLPIIQGATFAFIPPTIGLLSLPKWRCPFHEANDNLTASLPVIGGEEHREMWQSRIREVQGAVLVASLFQILVGFSGIIGLLLNYIGPLVVTPTVTLVGLALFQVAADKCAAHWWIAIATIIIIIIFSQYLRNIEIPCGRGRSAPVFKLFPSFTSDLHALLGGVQEWICSVLIGIGVSWLICYILTLTNALPDKPGQWGYEARTDVRTEVLSNAAWFDFPYPGQWGLPTVSVAGVFGMLAGVLASMIESIGDYYACARLSGAPPPPTHAINRGIGIEGIGCLLAGAWGSANGTTSYSENIGAIGITKVGSRVVVQVGAALMLLLGCLGKFGALFVSIPDPIIGGVFMIMFAVITAVGLSNLQFVDLNSSRNLFVLGFSLFVGLSIPYWIHRNPGVIKTGSDIADQILTVLAGTGMFMGGAMGFLLDNTIPGNKESRGILKWRELSAVGNQGTRSDIDMRCYDLPLIQVYLDKVSCFHYVPVCPAFSRRREECDAKNSLAVTSDDVARQGVRLLPTSDSIS